MNFGLQGSYLTSESYKELGAILIPCASQVQIYDGSYIGGEDYCEWD